MVDSQRGLFVYQPSTFYHQLVPKIELTGLTMQYGDLHALQGLNLTIAPGEFFAFLGPNGAGKTTAIKLVSPGS